MTIQAIIFDMDGVLVDSEEFICKAAVQMFANRGLTVQPEDFTPYIGTGEDMYLGSVAAQYGFTTDISSAKAETYSIYLEIIKGQLKALPGVHEFIKSCRSRDLKLALATSADEVKMTANLREIGLEQDLFSVMVNGLMVENKKPAPDIYTLTINKLGLEPGDCLVIEDAVNGVRAAKTAGAHCMALETSFSADKLQEADRIIPDLSHYEEGMFNFNPST